MDLEAEVGELAGAVPQRLLEAERATVDAEATAVERGLGIPRAARALHQRAEELHVGLGLDEAAHEAEGADQLAVARQHSRNQRVVGTRAADDFSVHVEACTPVVQDDAGVAGHDARAERLVEALQERYRHTVAVNDARAHGSPGGLGDRGGWLSAPGPYVLLSQQVGDVGAVADVGERVLER